MSKLDVSSKLFDIWLISITFWKVQCILPDHQFLCELPPTSRQCLSFNWAANQNKDLQNVLSKRCFSKYLTCHSMRNKNRERERDAYFSFWLSKECAQEGCTHLTKNSVQEIIFMLCSITFFAHFMYSPYYDVWPRFDCVFFNRDFMENSNTTFESSSNTSVCRDWCIVGIGSWH